MKHVIVVGGGAAGLIAAVTAARKGCDVILLEQNEKLGKKIFITGKGRCNFTNACETEELFQNVVTNSRFLYSAFYGFTSQDTIDFFEQAGVRTKVERGNRAFPLSDHSSDIIRALEQECRRLHVEVRLHTKVKELLLTDYIPEDIGGKKTKYQYAVQGVKLISGETLSADEVILATGGLSYPSTGSTGDGYAFAKQAGHEVTTLRPALVPLETEESYITEMQGLSLRNVTLTIPYGKKKTFQQFGEMLFTHFGVSGPLVLSASSFIGQALENGPLPASIDLKPALTEDQLNEKLLREFETSKNKAFKNGLPDMFPSKMRPVIIRVSGISPDKPIHDITKEERERFVKTIKAFPFTITGTRGYREAIITQGGVRVKEVNPSTMESKICHHLYMTGEMLDLDAVTGGFNLQIAWATGVLAAQSISEE